MSSHGRVRTRVARPLRAARAATHALRMGLALAPLARNPLEAIRIAATALRLRARAARHARPERWSTLRLRTDGRDFTMVVADYGDLGALREVFVRRAYELDARCAPHFVLDLGAHIGAATVFFKLRYPNAVVHAVEPNPATFARLRANVAQFEGVTTVELAVAGEVGDRVLDIGHGSLDSMLQAAAPRPGARVTTATLDGLVSGLGWERVDVLKLDIEGAEEEVLAASRSLERVGAIVGEVHPARVHEEHFFSLLEGFAVTRGRRRVNGRTFVATRAAGHQAPR